MSLSATCLRRVARRWTLLALMLAGSWAAAVAGSQAAAVAEDRTLVGHTDPVYTARFLPDGRTLATGSFDKTIRLWDLPSGQSFRTFRGHTGLVLGIDASPMSPQLASGSLDNTIRLWDLPQRAPAHQWTGHGPHVVLASSPDGQLIATAGGESQPQGLQFWNPADLSNLRRIESLPFVATRVAIRPDRQLCAIANEAGRVAVYNVNEGTLVADTGAHEAGLTGLAFSLDNQFLLTCGRDGTLRRWAGNMGARRQPLNLPAGCVASRNAGNSQTFATITADKAVTTWNLSDGARQRVFEGIAGEPRAIDLSGDGSRLLVASDDKVLRLFDVGNGQLVKALPERADQIVSVTFHPNQQEAAVITAPGTLEIVRVADDGPARTVAGHAGGTFKAVFTSDQQKLLSIGADRALRVWNAGDGAVIREVALPATPTSLAASWDNQTAAIGLEDGRVCIVSLGDGSIVQTLTGPTKPVRVLEYSRDQQRLLAGSDDGTVHVWRVNGWLPLQFFVLDSPVAGAGFQGDSAQLTMVSERGTVTFATILVQEVFRREGAIPQTLSAHPNGGLVLLGAAEGKVWQADVYGGNVQREFVGLQGTVTALAVHPNQQQIVGADDSGQLIVWNANDGRVWFQSKLPATAQGLQFTPDGSSLVMRGSDHLVRSFSTQIPEPQPTMPLALEAVVTTDGHNAGITGLGVGSDQRSAWTSAADGTISRWHLPRAQAAMTLQGHQSQVYSVDWHPTQRLVASGSNDKTLRVWNADTGQPVWTSPAQAGAVYCVRFSPDGQFVAACGGGPAVLIASATDGKILRQLEGPTDALYALSFSPDGQQVAAGGIDRKVFVWPIAGVKPSRILSGHTDDIYQVDWNGAGTRLLSVGYGGTIFVWDTSKDLPVWRKKVPTVLYSGQYSPTSDQVAVYGNDSSVQLLDLPTEAR